MAKITNRTKGTRPLGIALDERLVEEVEEFRLKRGETRRKVIEQALRRHMDNPPPLELPALPPVSEEKPTKRKGK